jgi:uncharacterized membrane protein YcaP (DUF421 family)
MEEFWRLSMPWWHFVLRAMFVYGVLLLFVRLSGKRALGQFTPFDMVLLVLLGTAVQNSLIGDDISVLGGLILAATLIALNAGVGWLAARSPRFQRLAEGSAVQVIEDGRLDDRRLQREGVSRADLDEALRRAGLERVAQVQRGWVETDGRITLIPRD